MSTDRILVLGGGGFLGHHLLEACAGRWDEGALIVAASRRPEEGARRAGLGPIVERRLDLEVPGALEATLDELRPAFVFNAAALSRVAHCEREPERARCLNEQVPGELARWCARRSARLVHVSTDLVFGGLDPIGERFAEGDEPSPVHEYGRTKAAGEKRVLQEAPAALVVRLPLLFGDSDGMGEGASDSLLASVRSGDVPGLFTDEWRTPLDVSDAARAIVEASKSEASGILHVAGPERLSRHELGLLVLEGAGHARSEAAGLVRAVTRVEVGLGERPSDVSLDASLATGLLSTPLRRASAALAVDPSRPSG